MSLPVMKPDRRRTPRINPGGLAYINIEPDNGGIVLNISDGGLCFESVALVRAGETIHFWFSAEGNRIEAKGRLVWIDKRGKTGGLQFGTLPAEARQQFRNWLAQPEQPLSAEHKPRQPVRPLVVAVGLKAKSIQSAISIFSRATQAALSRWFKAASRRGEFSCGLATGLLIALAIAGPFVFRAHRRQVGEWLIQLGERFAPRSKSQPLIAPLSPFAERLLPQRTKQQPASPKASATARDLLPQWPRENVVAPRPSRKADKPIPAPVPAVHAEALTPVPLPVSPPPTLVGEGKAEQPWSVAETRGERNALENKPGGLAPDNSEDVGELNSGLPFGKYFEIGRFKDEQQAYQTEEDLAHAGFHATVIPKNLLWMNSYQVLAGPYTRDEDAQAARRDLRARGFRPHSLSKRSRELIFSPAFGDPKALAGDFVVSWEPYSPDATVKFTNGNFAATGQGKWVRRRARYANDGIMYERSAKGSRTLLEIWFRGMSQSLVLSGRPASRAIVF